MKRNIWTIFVVLLTGGVFALEDISLPTGGGFYEGKVYQPRTIAESNITAVAPRFIGELLLGKESGSNALWIARNLTTNGWSLIASGGLCVVTNKGAGYTNVITYIGTVSGTLAP